MIKLKGEKIVKTGQGFFEEKIMKKQEPRSENSDTYVFEAVERFINDTDLEVEFETHLKQSDLKEKEKK